MPTFQTKAPEVGVSLASPNYTPDTSLAQAIEGVTGAMESWQRHSAAVRKGEEEAARSASLLSAERELHDITDLSTADNLTEAQKDRLWEMDEELGAAKAALASKSGTKGLITARIEASYRKRREAALVNGDVQLAEAYDRMYSDYVGMPVSKTTVALVESAEQQKKESEDKLYSVAVSTWTELGGDPRALHGKSVQEVLEIAAPAFNLKSAQTTLKMQADQIQALSAQLNLSEKQAEVANRTNLAPQVVQFGTASFAVVQNAIQEGLNTPFGSASPDVVAARQAAYRQQFNAMRNQLRSLKDSRGITDQVSKALAQVDENEKLALDIVTGKMSADQAAMLAKASNDKAELLEPEQLKLARALAGSMTSAAAAAAPYNPQLASEIFNALPGPLAYINKYAQNTFGQYAPLSTATEDGDAKPALNAIRSAVIDKSFPSMPDSTKELYGKLLSSTAAEYKLSGDQTPGEFGEVLATVAAKAPDQIKVTKANKDLVVNGLHTYEQQMHTEIDKVLQEPGEAFLKRNRIAFSPMTGVPRLVPTELADVTVGDKVEVVLDGESVVFRPKAGVEYDSVKGEIIFLQRRYGERYSTLLKGLSNLTGDTVKGLFESRRPPKKEEK